MPGDDRTREAEARGASILAEIEGGRRPADVAAEMKVSVQRVHQLIQRAKRRRGDSPTTEIEPTRRPRYPRTPDGRYFIVRGRLWRLANPNLPEGRARALVRALMDARRAIAAAKRRGDADAERDARAVVDIVKRDLGERGPVWWTDGAPDLNRHMVHTTPYADWYAKLAGPDR